MKHRRATVLGLFALVAAASPVLADPIDDLYDAAEQTVHTAYDRERQVSRTASTAVVRAIENSGVDPNVPMSRQLSYYTDAITIKDHGSGPMFAYKGVFANPLLWTCEESTAGAPTVTCTAVPDSNIRWECGVMHVSATATPPPRRAGDWARNWAEGEVANLTSGAVTTQSATQAPQAPRAPQAPDLKSLYSGRVAGHVSCDDAVLETDQANDAGRYKSAVQLLGPVTTFVCRAQLDRGDPSAPIPAYSVMCVDPAYPQS